MIKKTLLLFAMLVSPASLSAADIDIVPVPAEMTLSKGTFNALGASVMVSDDAAAEASEIAEAFRTALPEAARSRNCFVFSLDRALGPEEYTINVKKKKVTVHASSRAGFFYAVQTLKQMLPIEIYGGKPSPGSDWSIPCVSIKDFPAFAYRGLLLDCCRHFFSVREIERYLDIMAMYKMNRFHWHLSDDQGWRIESKLYPRLTEVGSVRKGTQIGRDRKSCDNIPYGGFYTQEEVRHIIAYAAERCITIIPEIDLPGHMLAALTAYPELGCTGGPYEVRTCWGVTTQVLNPANPATMKFLKDICGEVADLFPGEYFHIGGDECPKKEWEKNEQCQELIKSLGYVTDAEATKEQRLQNWVTAQMQEYLATKGKKVIGWDEILEGDLQPGAAVMSWRSADRGILAAQKGFDVIMTPRHYMYLDYVQSPRLDQEPQANTRNVDVTWQKTYSFDPFDQLTEEQKKHIIGVQGNLWTEYIATESHLEYMLIPRIFAVSEVQWSPVSTRSEERLYGSMSGHQLKIMDLLGYNYRKLDPMISGK